MSKLKHPLPKGTLVKTLLGEVDYDFEDQERETPPGAVGRIDGIAKSRQDGSPGFAYDLVFDSTEAWIVVDDCDLDDPARYQVQPPAGSN
jgi:hypothetical protein